MKKCFQLPRSNMARLKNKKAFSLIELLCALAIILTIATLSVSSFNFISSLIMRTELMHLKQVFHAARVRARATRKPTIITINTINHSVEFDGTRHNLPSFLRWGVLPNAKGPPSSPHTLVVSATTFPNHTVSCSPSGIIAAGTIYAKDTRNSVQYALTCGISNSSFIRIYRWDHGTWKALR